MKRATSAGGHPYETAPIWIGVVLLIAAPTFFYLWTRHIIPSEIPAAANFTVAPARANQTDGRTAARMAAAARFEAMRQTWRPTNEAGCLAEAMYYEAVGEGVAGQEAVAEVILERTRDGNYPRTICGVVHEGVRPGRIDCQFTYACDGSIARPKRIVPWMRVRLLADEIISGAVKLANRTGHAVAYHNTTVTPVWSGTMEKTTQIGNHIFYRWPSQPNLSRTMKGELAGTREKD
jgi:spore germination cell wall hydrolase CwlJ-like protein